MSKHVDPTYEVLTKITSKQFMDTLLVYGISKMMYHKCSGTLKLIII